MNKYILGSLIILCVILVSGCVSSESEEHNSDQDNIVFNFTDLYLDEYSVDLLSNQTQVVINGTTEAEYVTINCPSLNISNVRVNVTNGSFKYEIKDIPRTNIKINEKYTAEEAGKKQSIKVNISEVKIVAKAPKLEDNRVSFSIKRIITPAEIEEEFKNSCKNLSYDELVKVNPYNFKGVRAEYSGEVINFKPITGYMVFGSFDLAINGNRNQIMHLYYNGNEKIKDGDELKVWCEIGGDKIYSEKELSEGTIYAGSSVDYGSYKGYGYSSGGFGLYELKGENPRYNTFYTSIGDYTFQPFAHAWYVKLNN
jgi:hypothetical protein